MAAISPSSSSAMQPTQSLQSIEGPVLAILSGYSITTWKYDSEDEPIARTPHGNVPISNFCWNHNRLVLATCSMEASDESKPLDHNVALISSQSGSRLDSFRHNQGWERQGVANSIQFGGKSRYLCLGDESGALCLWDLKKKTRVRQFFHNGHPSRQVSLDPTDTYVFSLTPFCMYVYNLRDGIQVATIFAPGNQDNQEANTVAFTKYCTTSLEPNIVAIGTSDGSIQLYDFTNISGGESIISRPILSLTKRHEGAVTDVAFSSTNPKILVSSGEDGTVKVYDISTVETIQEIQNADITTPITSLSLYGGEGNICAIGCESGHVCVYDLDGDEDGALLATMDVGGRVDQIQFAPPPRTKEQTDPRNPPKTAIESRNSLPMAPTPAKFRIQVTTPSIKSPGTLSSGSPTEKVETIQENPVRSTAKPTYSAPFASAIRKSPLSPRRTAIVQATRQQQASTNSKSSPTAALLPPRSPTKADASPATKGSQSGDVNDQPLAIKPKATRPSFMKARSGTMREQLYPLRQQENIPEKQTTPAITKVRTWKNGRWKGLIHPNAQRFNFFKLLTLRRMNSEKLFKMKSKTCKMKWRSSFGTCIWT